MNINKSILPQLKKICFIIIISCSGTYCAEKEEFNNHLTYNVKNYGFNTNNSEDYLVLCALKENSPEKRDNTLVIKSVSELRSHWSDRGSEREPVNGTWWEYISEALFKIEKSEIDGYYFLQNKSVNGLVTYIPKEHAPEEKDHTLVIRDWPQYAPDGEWRNAALFSFSEKG